MLWAEEAVLLPSSIQFLVSITPFRSSFIRDVWIASVRLNTNYIWSVQSCPGLTSEEQSAEFTNAFSLIRAIINITLHNGELSEKWRVKMNKLEQLGSSTEQMTNGQQTHLDWGWLGEGGSLGYNKASFVTAFEDKGAKWIGTKP